MIHLIAHAFRIRLAPIRIVFIYYILVYRVTFNVTCCSLHMLCSNLHRTHVARSPLHAVYYMYIQCHLSFNYACVTSYSHCCMLVVPLSHSIWNIVNSMSHVLFVSTVLLYTPLSYCGMCCDIMVEYIT